MGQLNLIAILAVLAIVFVIILLIRNRSSKKMIESANEYETLLSGGEQNLGSDVHLKEVTKTL